MNFSDLPNHHAVLISHNDRKNLSSSLWNEITLFSPLNIFHNVTVLDIDTAREIIKWVNSSYNGERVALISFHSSTIPAQNAMLKILEEPREGVRFILITSNKESLLPTVLSRLSEFKLEKGVKDDVSSNAKLFLETKETERIDLDFISKILNSEDEKGRRDREITKNFLISLQKEASVNHLDSKYILEINDMIFYLNNPSSSTKMIVEYLALLLPKI